MERLCRLAVLCSVVFFGVAGCSGGSDGADPATCEGDVCGGACVDTDTNAAHCGGCGNACPDGQACVDGTCCPSGQALCGGACTDLTQRESCGACGTACGADEVCARQAGGWACTGCAAGQTRCGNACVDLEGDGANCGACGNACTGNLVCSGGECVAGCGGNDVACGSDCVNTNTHPRNCGGCGNVCAGNQLCFDGECGCKNTETQCGDDCVDTQQDPDHCGGCGNECPDRYRCVDGGCALVCRSSETICEDRCVDLNSDPTNCGACGLACAVGAICSGGACACPETTSLCDGVCVDMNNDARNCGGCGVTCNLGERCDLGVCTTACRTGEAICGDVCANLQDHPAHCGACGNECAPGFACVAGTCTESPLPDLSVDTGVLASSIDIINETFRSNDCAIVEGCVAGDGDRRLLRFSTRTPNLGTSDLAIGPPAGNPHLVWSPCHGHYHFEAYAAYRLLDRKGNVAAVGHKQAFCLMDINQVDPNAPRTSGFYGCGNQGISQGWADTYGRGLDCQWVDITGVPPGQYDLEIAVNPQRVFAELDYTNNVSRIPVEIPRDPNRCEPSPEVCFNGIDEDCTGVADDGCPPVDTNDTCANAFVIPPTGGTIGSRVTPTTADDVASSCGGAGGRDVIYRLDLAQQQLVYLSTFGSQVPTSLAIRSGSCGGAETACANDACGTQQEQWVGVLPAGTHYVVVEAHGVTAPTTVQLKVQLSGCTGEGRLSSGVQVTGDTNGATNARAACNNGGAGPEESWYFTTCPGDHSLTATTCGGTTWDSMLTITSGSCAGTALACADDDSTCAGGRNASTVNTTLHGDGLWWAIVDGFSAFNQGPYSLSVTWTPAAP